MEALKRKKTKVSGAISSDMQVWSFGALLKFFVLPLLVMHATLSTTSQEVEGAKKERKTLRKSPSMTSPLDVKYEVMYTYIRHIYI